jgi:hypothetical protein
MTLNDIAYNSPHIHFYKLYTLLMDTSAPAPTFQFGATTLTPPPYDESLALTEEQQKLLFCQYNFRITYNYPTDQFNNPFAPNFHKDAINQQVSNTRPGSKILLLRRKNSTSPGYKNLKKSSALQDGNPGTLIQGKNGIKKTNKSRN